MEGVETPTFVVVSLLIDHLCTHLNQPCFSCHYFSQCILLQIIYFTFYIFKELSRGISHSASCSQ